MLGSVIQSIGTAEFKDDLETGNQSEARNSLQRVCTKPESNSIIIIRGWTDQVHLLGSMHSLILTNYFYFGARIGTGLGDRNVCSVHRFSLEF